MEKDMSFTTFEFFLFIAAAVIIYYVIPKKLQWIWLLIISYVYYASYDISTVWMLLLTTYVTYRGGILLDRLNEQKPQDGISREEKKDFKKNIVRKKKKIGRNEPCPCGSGKKFKKCCIEKGIYD